MSSQARIKREEERRLNLRTLAIASVASATAAIVTSQFWAGGTPIAAAVTPVIVAIVSELLHRPTEKIVQRLTVETQALPDPGRQRPPPPPASTAVPPPPTAPTPPPPRPASVYRQPSRSLPWRGIAVTAALAFVIGALILTVPELIAGESIGEGSRSTSYFGGKSDSSDSEPSRDADQPPAVTQPQEEDPVTPPPTRTTPDEPPATQTTPTQTTPQTQTTPAPPR
jgi:hypothetical protein